MQHRGSSDSRAMADSHGEVQGRYSDMDMSRQRFRRDVALIWLGKLHGGSNESIILFSTPSTHSQSVLDRHDGKTAELGRVGLVHDCLTQFKEFTSGKRSNGSIVLFAANANVRISHEYKIVVSCAVTPQHCRK